MQQYQSAQIDAEVKKITDAEFAPTGEKIQELKTAF